MRPFPPCGGRLGRGVMQRLVAAAYRSRECAPIGAGPPFQLRLTSLRSLSLRILPPQGGQGRLLCRETADDRAPRLLLRAASAGDRAPEARGGDRAGVG